MRTPRLYVPLPLTCPATITLPEEAFHHAIRVLRLRPPAEVRLFNGQGGEFAGVIRHLTARQAHVEITQWVNCEVESPINVWLAQGVAKGERMDYTVQKAVELGVQKIIPLWTDYSVVHLQGERLVNKVIHWQGVAIGACMQCGRNRLPDITTPSRLSVWLPTVTDRSALKLVLTPEAGLHLKAFDPPMDAVILLIGPEGGLSDQEVVAARAVGFRALRLGPRILRTETAGIAALAAIQTLWGDLGA